MRLRERKVCGLFRSRELHRSCSPPDNIKFGFPKIDPQTSLTGHTGHLVNTFSHVVNRTCFGRSVNVIKGVPRSVPSLAPRASHLRFQSALVRLLRKRRGRGNAEFSCASIRHLVRMPSGAKPMRPSSRQPVAFQKTPRDRIRC